MTQRNPTSVGKPSQAVRAEAAAWIARLHGPDRTVVDEESFRRWLAAHPTHAVAFERMTTLWEAGTRLKSDALMRLRVRADHSAGASPRLQRLGWTAVGFAALTIGGLWYTSDTAVETRVGEQRTLILDDGTRLTLNTATRIEVRYDKQERRVELDSGEALFEVKTQIDRPFVVAAGESQIKALGTAFVVRRQPKELCVTLVEGKVAVSDTSHRAQSQLTPRDLTILSAGQRLTLVNQKPPTVDKPAIDKVTAWLQGLIAMDSMPLSVAVAEMNRYSSVPLIIDGFDGNSIQVSGVFKAGDSLEFAHALARSHGIYPVENDRSIVLSREHRE